jgi:hypothetical protein
MDFLQTNNAEVYANSQKAKSENFFRQAYPVGYTYSYQVKCFFPQKAQTIDIFEEKEIILQTTASYLSDLKRSFTFLNELHNLYKTILPFKILRGGYLALGLGAIGFVPSTQLIYIGAVTRSYKPNIPFYTKCFTRVFLGCWPFFQSHLTIRFFSKKSSLRSKNRLFFYNYSIIFSKSKSHQELVRLKIAETVKKALAVERLAKLALQARTSVPVKKKKPKNLRN